MATDGCDADALAAIDGEVDSEMTGELPAAEGLDDGALLEDEAAVGGSCEVAAVTPDDVTGWGPDV